MTASVDPFGDGKQWLEAALQRRLPEPVRDRWQPLRVGVVSLWEYDDAEFWYADGRMVLRGQNGAGKTKVLELTTLMLLRGETRPADLDPFGSQHRNMRFNLLPTGEGDDPRPPADAGLGYAWIEYGRIDEHGRPRFYVCGMGMSARRGTGTPKVNTWHFITPLRPGKDFYLSKGGRALDYKQLKQIDGIDLPADATAYRNRLARDLFGLPKTSYDNLTALLKTLRKPKLGEALSPSVLEEMMRDALPPLDDHEIDTLATGWDNLDRLRDAVEYTKKAAVAVATFVREGWKPWARTVARQRADDFTKATTSLDNTTRDRNNADKTLASASAVVTEAKAELQKSKQLQQDRTTEATELAESAAYREAAAATTRIAALKEKAEGLEKQVSRAKTRLTEVTTDRDSASTQKDRKAEEMATAEAALATAAGQIAQRAGAAGLTASVEQHLDPPNVEALRADHQLRQERFNRLRALQGTHRRAAEAADRSGLQVQQREADAEEARTVRDRAKGAVMERADELRQQIRNWAAAATVEAWPDDTVEEWCDYVSDLTLFDEDTGDTPQSESVVALMRAQINPIRQRISTETQQLGERRVPIKSRRDDVEQQLRQVSSQTETPPPAPVSWLRRPRPAVEEGLGAPLWQLVNPTPGVDDAVLAQLEAAAAAAGLLDAWISADGLVNTDDGRLLVDTQLVDTGHRPGRNLLEVLQPDPDGAVDAATVSRILAAIGWCDAGADGDAGDWLAADGSWRIGELTGRAEPIGPVSYLGAAARAAARQRRIEQLTADLTALAAELSEIDERLAVVRQRRQQLDSEEKQLPERGERALHQAVTLLAERSRAARKAAEKAEKAAAAHQADLALRDDAWSEFADHAAQHQFPTKDLDNPARALDDYKEQLRELADALKELHRARDALREAERSLTEQEAKHTAAEQERDERIAEHRTAQLQLATAEKTLSSGFREQLERKEKLDRQIAELAQSIEETQERLRVATGSESAATVRLDDYEGKRKDAEERRDAMMAALWELIDRDLVEPLGIPVPEKRSVAFARDFAAAIKREIRDQDAAALVERARRRCERESDVLRQQLLPDRDVRVEDADSPLMRISVLIDTEHGWLNPVAGSNALAGRVLEQQERFDAEQQRVLTTLLGSTFIEHLKDRLDYTADTFARISDQLAVRPNRQGHIVRVDWMADKTDADAEAVVAALRQGYHQLTADHQHTVRDFLRRRIEQARADAEADGAPHWKEQLAAALDYRQWLRITLSYRAGTAGKWAVLDAARHGAKSGGEKVVLLAQPLFAAVAVAYNAAKEHAPRSVWLDEAMTGVDPTVKANFMGLSVDFDLDIMITAFDEWCNYPTVPAIAIYDLARQANIAGVDCQTYLWCGGERVAVDVDHLGAATAAPAAGESSDD
ncbi:TIGR02680 family protein [Mycolicibacterium mucogenicum]|uniref:TIGR02680 family protein n=1 Tax=Mycolicibacterium mucogenicum TaxID=56689 RepID=A0A4R5W7R0_MYCMU|nr:TIGR02680 family protein [Mycolicibacterium mucogenicum]TDK84580.1 TIGR02680 family protein [Mycolicibacterium mucogenicum]